MRVSISELWHGGMRLDRRAKSLTTDSSVVGQLKIQLKAAERYATFTHLREGRETLIVPPMWRVEVLQLDADRIVLAGLQRTTERGPLQYQEWDCWILDKQKQW